MITVKVIIIYLIRKLIKLISIFFPIKNNQITISSFSGTNYNCNPKYISEELEKDNYYDIYWVKDKNTDSKIFPDHLKLVEKHSLKYVFIVITSKIILDNDVLPQYLPIRKKQVSINTNHGTGTYKVVGYLINGLDKKTKKILDIRSKQTNYYITGSKYYTEHTLKQDLHYYGKVLKIGMPRNDILFKNNNSLSLKIREKYGIEKNNKIVIYAPTFRTNEKSSRTDIDVNIVLNSLKKKFGGEWTMLIRAHHRFGLMPKIENAIDVSNYSDMQELLAVSDVLLTDYSTCLWDFSLMFKPCFVIALDLDEFKDKKGFYLPINQWPYPVAKTSEELEKNILNFEKENYEENVKEYFDMTQSYDCGKAVEQFKRFIDFLCKETDDEEFIDSIIE